MTIKQTFTEPETEVKWYFDSIEEIVVVSETGLEALLLVPATSTSRLLMTDLQLVTMNVTFGVFDPKHSLLRYNEY